MLFIDDSQVNYLEDIMWDQGYLDTQAMTGAFQLLRSTDLIWSHIVHEYLMGRRSPMNDLMAWNTDATRMPYRMHSEYLRRLFLSNDLFEGRYDVDGRPIALEDIRVPVFAVSTETDHVAPWRSVYKINLLSGTDVTFVLTSGGHNAGIVSEPGHKGRHYRISQRAADARYTDPETWYAVTKIEQGSWWQSWLSWLERLSHQGATPPRSALPRQAIHHSNRHQADTFWSVSNRHRPRVAVEQTTRRKQIRVARAGRRRFAPRGERERIVTDREGTDTWRFRQ